MEVSLLFGVLRLKFLSKFNKLQLQLLRRSRHGLCSLLTSADFTQFTGYFQAARRKCKNRKIPGICSELHHFPILYQNYTKKSKIRIILNIRWSSEWSRQCVWHFTNRENHDNYNQFTAVVLQFEQLIFYIFLRCFYFIKTGNPERSNSFPLYPAMFTQGFLPKHGSAVQLAKNPTCKVNLFTKVARYLVSMVTDIASLCSSKDFNLRLTQGSSRSVHCINKCLSVLMQCFDAGRRRALLFSLFVQA